VNPSPAIIADGIVIYPAIDAQLALEGIAISAILLMGLVGFGLMFYSSRFVFEPAYATRIMTLGIVIGSLSILVISYLFAYKLGAFT
jgi:hypothetical protein